MRQANWAGYFVGSITLAALSFLAVPWPADSAARENTAGMALFMGLIPWILGLTAGVAIRYALRIAVGEAIQIGGSCWWASPVLLAAVIPGVRDQGLLVAVLVFAFMVSFLVFPYRQLIDRVPEDLADRARLGVLCGAFALGLFFLFQTCLYHDALHTYGYLRSMVIDGDLDFYNEFSLRNSYFMYVPHPNEPMFHAGTCLALLPFFLLGHLVAALFQNGPGVFCDGYSWPYVLMTGLGNAAAGLAVVFLIYRMCRRFFGGFPALVATLATFWAGNLAFYTFVWPLYSHVFSVAAIALFILCWMESADSEAGPPWLLWGLLLGVAAWIRPQNALFGLLAAYEVLARLSSTTSPAGRRKAASGAVLFVLGAVLALTPQALLWHKTSGRFLVDVYGEIGDRMHWFHPRFLRLFFSMDKGLFAWTPVFLLALPGAYWLWKRAPRVTGLLGAAFLIQAYVAASCEYPEGRAGFGSRYLMEAMPFLALCLAAFVETIQRRIRPWIIVAGACLFIYVTLSMVILYHREMIPHDRYAPSMSELAGLLTRDVPRKAGEMITSWQINENVFALNVFSAFLGRKAGALLLALAGWAAACAFLAAIAMGLARWQGWRAGKARRAAIGIVAILLLADAGILGLRAPPPARERRVYPLLKVANPRQEAPPGLAVREFKLAPADSRREIAVPVGFRVRWVDVTGMLVSSMGIPSGAEIGRVTVEDSAGTCTAFPVAKDRDMADHGLFQIVDPGCEAARQAMKAKVVHHWFNRTPAGVYGYGAGYGLRLPIHPSRPVKAIRFEYLAPGGEWIVTGVNLVGE